MTILMVISKHAASAGNHLHSAKANTGTQQAMHGGMHGMVRCALDVHLAACSEGLTAPYLRGAASVVTLVWQSGHLRDQQHQSS